MTQRRLAFRLVAAAYEQFRPGYPDAVVGVVLDYAAPPIRSADDRPIRPWLFQVVRRLSIDAARARDTRAVLALDDGTIAEPATEDFVDGLLDRTVLTDAVRQLPPRQRTMVVEPYLRDAPARVTAARLGVPAGTAPSRLHYALLELRVFEWSGLRCGCRFCVEVS